MAESSKVRRSAEEQARVDRAITGLFERHIKFNQLLGLKVLIQDSGEVRLRFDMRGDLIGHELAGRLHGGVIASVLDTIGGLSLTKAISEKHCDEPTAQVMSRFTRLGTIDLRVDYLHQGVGKYFVASAKVTRLGGRIGSVQMTLENDEGVLIATGTGAYIVS